jgi:hypothetical protein
MREHSRIELGRKLSRYAEEGDDIEALLDFLEKNNWLSQERFAESLVNRRAGRYGNSRVLAELQQHGVKGEDLDELKSGLKPTPKWRAPRKSGAASSTGSRRTPKSAASRCVSCCSAVFRRARPQRAAGTRRGRRRIDLVL